VTVRRNNPVKVLIVDDSALVRQVLESILDSDPDLEVVGSAADPYIARQKIKQLNPDVITLDVEMPRMDGVTFLRNLMRLRPMPVVMVSSLTEKGADVTLDAIELGAIDFVTKPKIDVQHALKEYASEIINKVKMASAASPRPYIPTTKNPGASKKLSADAVLQRSVSQGTLRTTDYIVALGASTGGTEAIKEVLMALPADAPGMVITQHIPAAFSASFAKRMDSVSAMSVCEARDGQQIMRGHCYIAPGDRHLTVVRNGTRYTCRLDDGPPVNRHKPSVDVLFRSVADQVGLNAISVLLTGMGDDGAHGMGEMQQAGAFTIAQDEDSSVVWGMPGEAVKLGNVDLVVPLSKVASAILAAEEKRRVAATA
jgi:two-component system chemotaxis response regulator CheB